MIKINSRLIMAEMTKFFHDIGEISGKVIFLMIPRLKLSLINILISGKRLNQESGKENSNYIIPIDTFNSLL
jgi:hypothetical protein